MLQKGKKATAGEYVYFQTMLLLSLTIICCSRNAVLQNTATCLLFLFIITHTSTDYSKLEKIKIYIKLYIHKKINLTTLHSK